MKKISAFAVAAAILAPGAVFAEEETLPADSEGVVESAPAAGDASVEAANDEAAVTLDANDKVQEAFDGFIAARNKKDKGFSAYGKAHPVSGITYFAVMEPVSGPGPKDPEFIQKRQTAFMRAFAKIREDYVKSSLNGTIRSCVDNLFESDKGALDKQDFGSSDQVDRLAKKTLALAEADLDRKLEDCGVDPAQFDGVAAKRKALSQKILAECASHAFGSCSGISVVKTVEGGAADGYTIGVIAKFDPQYVFFADCMAKGKRPMPSAPGIDVGEMLKGDLSQNFGTRFYYDEKGMPALVSFGQWGGGTAADRTERMLQEKAARLQAEAQANVDMNNFISGSLTFDEAVKGGEEWSKTISYNPDGTPVASEISATLADFVSRTSTVKASLRMAGREVLVSKMVTHPDTKQKIAVAAVGWSFTRLAEQVRVEEMRRRPDREVAPEPPPAEPEPEQPGEATLREGDEYDF
ncbi:MAG: hypothetical protein K6F50_00650 [Kiritimatiellae bacterium]|nr:hypothetical protein [Kiritimatiellia bacterium]